MKFKIWFLFYQFFNEYFFYYVTVCDYSFKDKPIWEPGRGMWSTDLNFKHNMLVLVYEFFLLYILLCLLIFIMNIMIFCESSFKYKQLENQKEDIEPWIQHLKSKIIFFHCHFVFIMEIMKRIIFKHLILFLLSFNLFLCVSSIFMISFSFPYNFLSIHPIYLF